MISFTVVKIRLLAGISVAGSVVEFFTGSVFVEFCTGSVFVVVVLVELVVFEDGVILFEFSVVLVVFEVDVLLFLISVVFEVGMLLFED